MYQIEIGRKGIIVGIPFSFFKIPISDSRTHKFWR
jgi:hypothetical protein